MTSKREDTYRRQEQALELRLAGLSYSEIASRLEYRAKGSAYKAVRAALERRGAPAPTRKTTEEELRTELTRLDAMLEGLWPKARRGDVAAVDRVLKIEERRERISERADKMRRAAEASDAAAAKAAGTDGKPEQGERTALSEFERRRQQRAAGARSAGS